MMQFGARFPSAAPWVRVHSVLRSSHAPQGLKRRLFPQRTVADAMLNPCGSPALRADFNSRSRCTRFPSVLTGTNAMISLPLDERAQDFTALA